MLSSLSCDVALLFSCRLLCGPPLAPPNPSPEEERAYQPSRKIGRIGVDRSTAVFLPELLVARRCCYPTTAVRTPSSLGKSVQRAISCSWLSPAVIPGYICPFCPNSDRQMSSPTRSVDAAAIRGKRDLGSCGGVRGPAQRWVVCDAVIFLDAFPLPDAHGDNDEKWCAALYRE